MQLNGQMPSRLDAHQFEKLLERCNTHHALSAAPGLDQSRCPERLARLQQVADLYRGEFLEGLTVEHSPPLEEWINLQRQHFEVRVLAALSALTLGYEHQQDYGLAYQYAQRQINIDPLREEGQRQTMRILARRGQREEALALYDRLRRKLRKELGAEPAPETVELAKHIRRGTLADGVTADSDQQIAAMPLSTRRFGNCGVRICTK